MRRSADISPCGTWRYALFRVWNEERPTVTFIGLNPSTADAEQDDPTARRMVGFAKSWGYGALTVVNLFAVRATDPRDIELAPDPIGPHNDAVLTQDTRDRVCVCCWGTHGDYLNRGALVAGRLLQLRRRLVHLGRNRDGSPKHPLYLPSNTPLLPWSPPPGPEAIMSRPRQRRSGR